LPLRNYSQNGLTINTKIIMKTLFKLGWLTCLLPLLWACGDLEQPPIIQQTPSTISSPPSEIVISAEDADEVIVFNVSPADFGTTMEVTYTIQLDRPGNNFANPANLGSSTSTSVEVKKDDINGAAIARGVTAGESGPMEFRVRAVPSRTLSGLNGEAVTINVSTTVSANPDVPLTLQDLVGSGTLAWRIKPAAGAWGVGPTPGSLEWFPGASTNLAPVRPCSFNDLYIFSQDGTFEYDAQGDIWGEDWMGLESGGCQPESNLEGTVGEAWGSGTHEFTFTPGTATETPQITVTGTGAFIGFPRAFNGGEYPQGPPNADESVTYNVVAFDPMTKEMQLSINSGNGDPDVFWTFVLVPDDMADLPGEEETAEFTLQDLIGAGSQAWQLKSGAGAFGVGPAPGSDAFFPNGGDISGDRPCLFNDLFIFRENGEFEYDAQGDIFAEPYMGIDGEGCQDESSLEGTVGAAWASGIHEFSFQPASGNDRAQITVTGTGAFIALPKAYNGGEYDQGPPRENESVTYDVLDFDSDTGELTLVIDITNDGSVWWTFVLIPVD
jgi:hypothetical protein